MTPVAASVVEKIEPEAGAFRSEAHTDEALFLASIAISLKRIADTLEKGVTTVSGWDDEGVPV